MALSVLGTARSLSFPLLWRERVSGKERDGRTKFPSPLTIRAFISYGISLCVHYLTLTPALSRQGRGRPFGGTVRPLTLTPLPLGRLRLIFAKSTIR